MAAPLNISDTEILSLLLEKGPMTPRELRARTGHSRSGINFRLRRLDAAGQVIRREHVPGVLVVYYHPDDPYGVPEWREHDTRELMHTRCRTCGELDAVKPTPHVTVPPEGLECNQCRDLRVTDLAG